jgi:hypothetical protein
MSASEFVDGGGDGGLPYDLSGHTDCDAPLGLVVHNGTDKVRLPIINDGLQLYERKVGPTAITRRAEATIPIEDSAGTNWTQYVSAFQPVVGGGTTNVSTSATGIGFSEDVTTESTLQIADVIGQPLGENGEPVGDPSVLFRGYVGAVGSREGVNRARLQVYDPMKFLGQIEAGMSFKDPSVREVLAKIRDDYLDGQNVFTDVDITTDTSDTRLIQGLLAERGIFTLDRDDTEGFTREELPSSFAKETFSTNRDTLVDVIDWLQGIANVRVWFQPSGERGVVLAAVVDSSRTYDLTPSSGVAPYVIKNNALYELSPINGVKVKGNVGTRVENPIYSFTIPHGNTYIEAKAVYPPLRDRFGGEQLKTITSKQTNGEVLQNQAAKALKEAVDAEADGEMVTTLAPSLTPYDRVESTPACAGVTTDVPPLRYEVQEAVHSVVPSDNNLPRTEINVSMSIRAGDIVTDADTKDAQTGEKPSDNEASDNYEPDYQTAP